MKNLLLFLLLLLCAEIAFGQMKAPKGYILIANTPENFSRFSALENPSKEQLDTLIQLSKGYNQVNKDTTLILVEKAMALTIDHEDQNMYGKALDAQGMYLNRYGEGEACVESWLAAKSIFEKTGNKVENAKMNKSIGSYYLNTGDLEKSAAYFLKSIALYKESDDPRGLMGTYGGIAGVYFYLGDYIKCQEYLSEAIIIADTTNLYHDETAMRSNRSSVLFEIGHQYEVKADTIPAKATLYRDSAQLYYDMAFLELDIASDIAKDLNDPFMLLTCLQAIAGLKNQSEDYQGAKTAAIEGVAIAEEMDIPLELTRMRIHLGEALFELKDYDKSIVQLEKAYEVAKEKRYNQELAFSYDLLIANNISKGNAEKALSFLKEKTAFEKEQNTMSTKRAITEAETKYQTAEKENEILQQKNDILELESTNAKIQKQKNYMLGGGLLLGLLSFIGFRFNKIRKDRNNKKEFAEALIFAQEEERKRIARDLHDGVGQSLLLIKKQMASTAEVTLENKQLISDTLEEVRSISRDLHPFQLEKFGLTATIEDTIQKVEQSTDIFITKEIQNIDKLLPAKSEIHLYRTIQEALSNIVKHSGATAAQVNITATADKVNVIIRDNGKGFDLDMAVVASKSLGLRTMYERISSIGGQLKFEKGQQGGTVVSISINS